MDWLNPIRRAVNRSRAVVRRARLRLLIPNAFWREVINARGLPFDEIKYQSDGGIELLGAGLILPAHPVARDILWYYRLLVEILAGTDAEASWSSESDELQMRFGAEVYPVKCAEEIYTLHELFVLGDYNIFFDSEVLLMDIGANVGYTSIYLAAQNPDLQVLAYEPLEVSYLSATRNVSLNAHLSDRISLRNFGLSGCSGAQTIQSEIAHRTRSSMVIDRAASPLSQVEYLPISVRKASEEVCEVLEQNPNKSVWIKMDCEGCEYKVLEDLAESGTLDEINGILLEWHAVDPAIGSINWIRDVLTANGFCVYLQKGENKNAEMGICLATR
ncbi:MAG: FkbM family methyltransferase [bacterium]